MRRDFDQGDIIYQGIPSVPIKIIGTCWGGKTTTDDKGYFSTSYMLQACPGFQYELQMDAHAMIRYRSFNTKREIFSWLKGMKQLHKMHQMV